MIAQHVLCGSLVLLSYTCVVTSDNNTCVDVNRDGICDDQQPQMHKNSIGFGVDGLPSPALLVVTPIAPDVESSPCTATLVLGGEWYTLNGSLTAEGFDLWGGEIALRAQRRPRDMDYAATLMLGKEGFQISLTPQARPEDTAN
jgi:hypothetical protein